MAKAKALGACLELLGVLRLWRVISWDYRSSQNRSLTSGVLAALGTGAGLDIIFGFVDSTSAMPKRAARALRFSSSSSTAAGVCAEVLDVSLASGVAFGGTDFD